MRAFYGVALILATGAAQTWAGEATPAGTAMTFYLLANQGKCAEAEALFSREAVAIINRTLGSSNGFLEFCTSAGHTSPLLMLHVKSERLAGDRAIVEIERTYQAGLAFETDVLVRQPAGWKLVVGENQNIAGGRK